MYSKLKELCQYEVKDILEGEEFKFIDNGADILAVCHCDTVFDNKILQYKETERKIYSPRLDDRLGVFALLHYLPEKYPNMKYDILLTNDEEIGQSTAMLFETKKEYKWIFEVDRAGQDVVMYDYDTCKALKTELADHLEVAFGAFSDICELEDLGVGAFNIGCGYYMQHTLNCYMIKKHFENQMDILNDIYESIKDTKFDFTPKPPVRYGAWKSTKTGTWDNYYANRYPNLVAPKNAGVIEHEDLGSFIDDSGPTFWDEPTNCDICGMETNTLEYVDGYGYCTKCLKAVGL